MSTGLLFFIVVIIVIVIFEANRAIDTRKFFTDTEPYLRFLMEDDYKFLLTVKYGEDVDVAKLFTQRIRNGIVTIFAVLFAFMSQYSLMILIAAIAAGIVVFKSQYTQLKSYYRANLYKINLMLPYFLKSLEILIQHYTVPVALSKSIDTAPEVFRPGLRRLISKIDSGDSSVDPYMDFAKEYPVKDSMRMMRLLYRLGIGSQENKQEQIILFSRNVSTLQNKAREQRYRNRLETMEKKTMIMLACTGGGIIILLLVSMLTIMGI